MGQLIYDLGNKQWNIPKLRELLETILPQKTTFDNYEVEHEFSTIGRRIMLLNARQIQRVSGKERIILLAIEDITERKRLEDLLTESEMRYRRIFETASDGIVLLEKNEGHIVHANPAAEKMLGYSEEEYNGKMLQDIGVPLDMSDFPAIMQSLSRSGILNYDDVQVKTKSGQYIDTDIYMVDRARLAQCNIRDVTERKQTEEELKFRNVILSTQQEASIDGILVVDESGRILSFNRRFCELWNIPSELLETKSDERTLQSVLDNIVDPDNFLQKVRYLYEHQRETSRDEIALRDGRTFDRYSAPMLGSDGKYYGRVWHFRDITERKKAEEEVKASEEKYRSLVESALIGVYRTHLKGDFLYVNEAMVKMFEFESPEELISFGVLPLYKNLKDREVLIENLKNTGKVDNFELEILTKTGKTKNILMNTTLDGDFISGMFIDITERKQAEKALRTSEAELHDNYFAQSTINMILSESLENRPLEEILQKALNMILTIPWLSFEAVGSIHIVEDEPDVLVMKAQYNLTQQLKKSCAHLHFGECLCGKAALTQKIEFADHIDERHDICYEGMAPHGHYVVPLLFGGKTLGVINIHLKEGHIRSQKEEDFLLAVADTLAGVIARRQVEDEKEKLHAQLLQSQKMEAVGQLAGGIAHDFNNILTAMMGYGHLLKMKLKEEDPLRSYAEHILFLSDRAGNLTHSLLAFSRKQIMNPRPVDLNEIVRRIDHLLSRIIGEDIRLQTMLSEKALIVMADPGQIEQVLMNLATNAKDAMPAGGLLTIQTETVAIDHEFIKGHGFGKEGPYVLLSLTDTGAGMERETREKIFEPFFTTKEVGKGTGLGLAMAYGIIKQHEGYINVYSEPGRGTTFRIYLPLIQGEAEEIKPKVIQPVETGTETVLLAEDETAVREFTKKLLEEYGYKVIEAIDGQDAINKFKVYKNEIQFVLLDVIMPNKNGKEVYGEIKQIRPDIKVLFMSGYPADIIQKHDIIENGFAYIEKPASPTKLLRKIREVLNE